MNYCHHICYELWNKKINWKNATSPYTSPKFKSIILKCNCIIVFMDTKKSKLLNMNFLVCF